MSAIMECSGLSKRFGGKWALSDAEMQLESGKIVGLLGPNGSGKSTLLKLANGLLTPSSGTLRIDGMAPGKATKAIVSYLPERGVLPDWMTMRQAMDFYADFYADFDRAKALEMVAALGLEERQRIKTMSKGTREKLHLILVMSRKARLYLLDEPIGGVDPATRDYILRTIIGGYREDATVLISTHLIADVEPVLDDVIFLREGHIELHESVDEIRKTRGVSVDTLFREVFRC